MKHLNVLSTPSRAASESSSDDDSSDYSLVGGMAGDGSCAEAGAAADAAGVGGGWPGGPERLARRPRPSFRKTARRKTRLLTARTVGGTDR